MNDIHKIGTEAVKALKALTRAKADKKAKTAKATELIEERNELARPLLQQVHDAIAAGQSVNGQSTWNGWAKQAGWSKRALNYILNGRKPKGGNSSSRSSFLTRIAEAKQKVGDIRRAYDAPFKPGEVKDNRVLDQINPIIAPVFEEFLALISPDGYEAQYSNRGTWYLMEKFEEEPTVTHLVHGNKTWCGLSRKKVNAIQIDQTSDEYDCPDCRKAKEEEPVIMHAKFSSRRTVCEKNFINRPLIKNKVFAKDWKEATCPDCQRFIKQAEEKQQAFDKESEELYAKKRLPAQFNKKEMKAYTSLKSWTDGLAKAFGSGTISAADWRVMVKELDDKNTGRAVFRTRHNRYMNFMKEVRTRMEAEIALAAEQTETEPHTGQHEDCLECFEYHTEQERLQLKWDAAYEQWRKRIQTLINTWRNGRLREESKYREEFEAASVKFQKRLKRGGLEHFRIDPIENIILEARGRMEGAIADRNRVYPKLTLEQIEQVTEEKETPIVTHLVGETNDGGSQHGRLRTYTLCGRRFSGTSWTTKERHISAHGETPTCPKCIELAKQKAAQESENLSEPAKALAAAVDAAEVPYDKEAYAKAENWSQKVCIPGSPERLQWAADLQRRRENPYCDPNEADDESEDDERDEDEIEEQL